MPLNKYSGRSEEICSGCKFLPTKPEAVPVEIIEAVAIGLELSELQNANATFAYPDALNSLEWHCLRGLTRGRERANKLKAEREKKKQRLEEKKKRLNG
jgi:hypothetical protein